jgi:adenine-specific DNA-methyltransferase
MLRDGEAWRLVLGDCLEGMREMPDGCVDVTITDPPYNVGINYGSTDDRRHDYESWCASWLAELERVCRGGILISCGIVNLGMWHRIKKPRWVLCWWKPAAMGRSPVGFNNWEPILLYGPQSARSSCDVIRAVIKPDEKLEGHPCPKPLGWALRQVEMLSEEGDLVFDPFAGLASVGVACLLTDRRFLGVEIDPAYHAIASERLSKAASACPLFTPAPTQGQLFGPP